MTVALSDPRPPYCSACHNTPEDGVYVDFFADFDSGSFAGREDQVFIDGSEDLHLCQRCVRDAANLLELKPELHQRQLREISRLETVVDYWREKAQSTAALLERALSDRPAGPPTPRRPGRPRKVPA